VLGLSKRLSSAADERGEATFMSASTESSQDLPAAPFAGSPPPGTVFGLGWLMAELFDGRRRAPFLVREPAFNAAVQLPLVADLDPPDMLNFLVTDLHDLLGAAGLPVSDAAVQGEAARMQPGSAEPFDQGGFDSEARALHLAVLDQFADDQEQLNAYQLGLALSDMCWLPTADSPDAFIAMFKRGQVAALHTWLNGAGAALPRSAAAVVGQSLTHWADWIDINVPKMKAASVGPAISALRVQGTVWHGVLTADPDVSIEPGMGAWVQAASAIVRAAGMLSAAVLRRFWLLIVVGAATLAGLLYLVIANLSGASQVWASLLTVATVLGFSGAGLGTGVSRALGGLGNEIWNAARLEAQAWNITWLPSMPQGPAQRARLDSRGVASPRIRKNVDT
jgi:hypothetical protein